MAVGGPPARSDTIRSVPRIRIATAMVIAALGLACGAGMDVTPAPSPTPAPAPAPGTGPLNLAGVWAGTLEAPGLPARTVSMLVVQAVDCVDGAFHTDPAEYTGAISGYSSQTAFDGSVSLQRPADGQGKCTGMGAIRGTLSSDTLTFSVPALSADCAAGGLPPSMTITLRRQ